MPLVVNTEHL
ncbi:unnamed protein product [Callosobruchus maculatus]|uniref:Uncharacterized protein n=1 Tax=Callosobruchus maculatus TaxID=64391 RepID=A0A653CAH7_CALMS|nr:unnamed protein product [Callosobruchus maculatus]